MDAGHAFDASDDQNEKRWNEAFSRELVDKGSELSGAMAGAAIGLLGGPPGALAGAAAGVALTHTVRWAGGEMRRGLLGPREEIRGGGAYGIALARIEERVRDGERVRDDFVAEDRGRSDAVELREGMLLSAAPAYEERKVPRLGRMYASLALTPGITSPTAPASRNAPLMYPLSRRHGRDSLRSDARRR